MDLTPKPIFVCVMALCTLASSQSSDWPVYGGQAAADHYSSLSQINRSNVHQLKLAWKYDAGEKGGLETSPLIVGRILYAYTANSKVIALDAATGQLIWQFDSGIKGNSPERGLAYWADGKDARIFASVTTFLYALNAHDGQPIADFGEQGRIDLRKGLRGDYQLQSVQMTSPGLVYEDLIIVGGRNPESHPSPPGDIRAFDAHTGAERWRFHTIPHPGEFGYETWPKDAWTYSGAANNWAGMSLDDKRGIVYIPTGSPTFDFYGADRVGDNLFAIRFSPSMPIPASEFGTFKAFITISGTAIFHAARARHSQAQRKADRRSRPGHKAGISVSLRSRHWSSAFPD